MPNISTDIAVFNRQRPRHAPKSSCCSSNSPHLMGHGPGRPVKTRGPLRGPGGAAHMEPTYHGPRPGPAHQCLRVDRRPAHPIDVSEDGPGPGPSHHIFTFSRPSLAWPTNFPKVSTRPGPARHNLKIGPIRPGPDKRPLRSPPTACHGLFVWARPGRAETF